MTVGRALHAARHPDGDASGSEKEPNWLPTSGTDRWFLILRLYRPHPEVITASWRCPGVLKVA
jgi:hypothetical protein